VLTEANLPHVLRLCQWVEGLPLALKLVTSWLSTLSLEQLGSAVGKLELLSQGPHDTTRHQSIQVAFDYSLELLSKSQREAFVKLAAFEGGFSLEAATALGVPVTGLRSLVEKSLLRFDAEKARYSFHPLLHQYARELLERDANVHEVKTNHANYFLDELMQVTNGATSELKARAMKYMGENLEKLSAAWHYATEKHWLERLFEACKPLQHFGDSTARYGFAADLLVQARAQSHRHPAAYVALTSNLGYLRYRLGRYQEAIELAGESIAGLDGLDIPKERKLSLLEVCYVTQYASYSSLGEFEKTLAMARELHDILSREAPESLHYGVALVNLMIFEKDIRGVYNVDRYGQAIQIFENNNQRELIPLALIDMTERFILMGKFPEAEQTLQQARKLAMTFHSQHWLMMSQYHQANLHWHQKDYERAKSVCKDLLYQAKNRKKDSMIAIAYRLFAKLELEQFGDYNLAKGYLEVALEHAKTIQDIALVNGLLVDQLGWYISQQKYDEARPLYALVKQEIHKMYYQDKETFQEIAQEMFD
jgi:tetratricopeptide (TPR) repeat protein